MKFCQVDLTKLIFFFVCVVGRQRMSRSAIAEQEALVKESLFKFVRKHIPSAQLR
jgi:hypothetical protein